MHTIILLFYIYAAVKNRTPLVALFKFRVKVNSKFERRHGDKEA